MAKGTVFISDLHLGDARWTPERYDLLNSFLDDFVVPHANQVVIAGDFVEWIQYGIQAISRGYDTILKIMDLPSQGIPVHYVVGNHDLEFGVLKLMNRPFSIVFPRHHMTIEGLSFHIEHGHYYDPTIKDSVVNKLLVKWGGRLMDRVPPGVEDLFGEVKAELLSRKNLTTGQKGASDEELDRYRLAANELVKGGHDFIIFGHTHAKEIITLDVPGKTLNNAIYVNTGDWQNHSDFAFFCNGEMRIFSWGSERHSAIDFAQGIA